MEGIRRITGLVNTDLANIMSCLITIFAFGVLMVKSLPVLCDVTIDILAFLTKKSSFFSGDIFPNVRKRHLIKKIEGINRIKRVKKVNCIKRIKRMKRIKRIRGIPMAKFARLTFSPLEYDYQRRYGKFPDYDFTDRLAAGEDLEDVSRLVNGRMDALWEECKERYKKEADEKAARLEAECPF